jgi:hypothetical protein
MLSLIIFKKEVIMPRGDRTGPLGEGPKTGRALGYCVGNEFPGYYYSGVAWGRGLGRRFRGGMGPGAGYGRGFHRRFGPFGGEFSQGVSDKTLIENEIRILKDQLSSLEEQLSKLDETK